MPDKVTLTRPDGSLVQVTPEEAARLKELGSDLQQESLDSMRARVRETGRDEYYSDQKLETFAEGAASGLTLGASDLLFEEVLDWDTAERAQYNPGTRIAGEIVGGIAPALVPGGGAAVLAKTPAGLATSLASRAGAAAGGSVAKRMAVAGAVEGSILGAAAVGVNATLTGDPLTAEAVLAGVGWGAVLGGGIGGFVGKTGDVVSKWGAARAAEAAADIAPKIPIEEWGRMRSAITEARTSVRSAVKTAEETIGSAANSKLDMVSDLTAAYTERMNVASKALDEIDAAGQTAKVRGARDSLLATAKTASKYAAEGDLVKFTDAMETHAAKLRALETAASRTPTEVSKFTLVASQRSQKALEEMKNLSLVADALEAFPTTTKGFVVTTPKKMETHIAAVEKLMSTGGAELEGVRLAVGDSIAATAQAAGLKIEGSVGEQLRGIYEIGRAAQQKAGVAATEEAARGGFFSRVAKNAAGRVAGGFVAGNIVGHARGDSAARSAAYGTASAATIGLLGVRGAVTNRLSDSIARWAPRIQRGAQKTNSAARVDPLRTRLDGTVDMEKKSRDRLMKERAEEFARNAGTVRETLYRSVSEIAKEHPEFAAAMIDVGGKQFDAMAARVPRDPGTAMVRMKSVLKPDAVTIEKFSRAYEVFQNPIAVATRALETGDIHPESARALRELSPEIFQVLRLGMIERLSEPGNLDKLSYNEQVTLGRLLDITIHSSQTPRFIAAQQAMYKERNQPLAVRPPGGSTSNNPSGGRPPGASAAQTITNH